MSMTNATTGQSIQVPVPEIQAGASVWVNVKTLPASKGRYYLDLLLDAGNKCEEANETNNYFKFFL